MTIADELRKLEELYRSGAINDDEYALAKARALAGDVAAAPDSRIQDAASPTPAAGLSPAERERQTRQWGLFLHLSLLANYLVPLAGIVAPIVIWQIKKDELPELDAHGKNAINWILSKIIYLVASAVLSFVVIGIPLGIAVLVCGVVFPIIAAVKANEGKVWPYPLAIPFLK